MGSSQRLLEQNEADRLRKQNDFLDLPASLAIDLAEARATIEGLEAQITRSQDQVKELREELRVNGTWKMKLKDWVFGATIGAIVSGFALLL